MTYILAYFAWLFFQVALVFLFFSKIFFQIKKWRFTFFWGVACFVSAVNIKILSDKILDGAENC